MAFAIVLWMEEEEDLYGIASASQVHYAGESSRASTTCRLTGRRERKGGKI